MFLPFPRLQDLEHLSKRGREAVTFVTRRAVSPWFARIDGRALDPVLLELLGELYSPLEPLRRCDDIYPVMIVANQPVRATSSGSTDPVLIAPEEGWQPQQAMTLYDRRRSFRRLRWASGAPVQDWRMYRMEQIDGQTIRAQLGRYDYMLETCESLEWEFRRKAPQLTRRPPASAQKLLQRLPARHALHRNVRTPATRGAGRSAGISMSVLTVYWHQGTWRLLIRRRSSRGVATDANRMHLVPSFMLAPEHGHNDDEFSTLHNLRREFAEELFGLKAPRDAEPIWFEHTPPVVKLDAMLASGEAEFWITGLAVGMLSLRPEVCALLWIKREDWYPDSVADEQSPLRVNEEFASHTELMRGSRGYIPNIVFGPDDEDSVIQTRASMTPSESVPVGAASFWLGIDHLRRLMARSPDPARAS